MPAAVEILFAVGGIRDVQAAIGGISRSLDQLARTQQTTAERGARAQVRAAQDAAGQQERIARDLERSRERRLAEDRRRQDRAMADEVRATERAEREKERIEERLARYREQVVRTSLRMEQSLRDRAAREQEARARAFGRQVGGSVQRVMGFAGKAAGIVGALGGGFAVADALQAGVAQQEQAGQIVRSAQTTGGLTKENVAFRAREAAIATGGRTGDVLAGLDQFVRKTGDLEKGVQLLQSLSEYAAASGTAMADMGSTAAEVFNQLGSVDETKGALLTLIGSAKAGAIDIRDLSQYGARLAAGAKLFEGGTQANIGTFGALAQIAKSRGGAVDAAEATEASVRLFDEIAQHRDKFSAIGVKTTGAGGKLRGVQDILLDTLVKTGGDLTAIPGLLGRQAGKVEIGLASAFLEGSGGRKDRDSLAAGRARAAQLISSFAQPVTDQEVKAAVADKLTETQSKLNVATERFYATLNDRLLPKLPALVDALTQLIPIVGKVVDIFAEFPKLSIGGVILAAVTADIAKAAIGEKIAIAIAEQIRKRPPAPGEAPNLGGSPPPPPGIGRFGTGLLGRALPVVGLVSEASDKITDMVQSGEEKRLAKRFTSARELMEKLSGGNASPDDVQNAKDQLRVFQGDVGRAKNFDDGVLADFRRVFNGGQQEAEELKAFKRHLAEANDVIASLTASLRGMNDVAGLSMASPTNPSRGGTQ